VGTIEGFKDGREEGLTVGSVEGFVEGKAVGLGDGFDVGISLGQREGKLIEGSRDGVEVGGRVG